MRIIVPSSLSVATTDAAPSCRAGVALTLDLAGIKALGAPRTELGRLAAPVHALERLGLTRWGRPLRRRTSTWGRRVGPRTIAGPLTRIRSVACIRLTGVRPT